ncbi:sensor histidine kinase [Pediococcus pentosaceus]|uniref:sensor histidine kinase n=1 Tax=Pediococcus pentosaceus TaxID=1255 RepID=UPI0018A12B76|nr:HAMP domain-containing sensor histidine kinase [Pediococcus pentosaceus]MBF7108919.1 HAMP domain-containing histidine kinase [Pediococcus pentosaceus]QQA93262.1 HAMP domain-containing histidine kinase [Pediococcus pentosaceus]
MKLKYLLIVGYIISVLITIAAVFLAVNKMVIAQSSGFLIILITLCASFLGIMVNLILMRPTIKSLERLRKQARDISKNNFNTMDEMVAPSEFKELSQDFNAMSAKLKETFKSLKDSENEKDEIIAQLSHDIKTPITSIKATVEGILDGIIAPEEISDYLGTIDRQTDRLNNLVEELSYLSLNQVNKVETEQETIFLDQLLIETMSEFQLTLEREKRKVAIDVTPTGAKIISDRDKLSRIVYNLINNAFKYSEEGTPLKVSAKVENKEVIISVTDRGQGISNEELQNIFKRLYRVEGSRNMNTGGHGLGLYIAQELAHQLNGKIRVKSEYGVGSTFSLVLKTNN